MLISGKYGFRRRRRRKLLQRTHKQGSDSCSAGIALIRLQLKELSYYLNCDDVMSLLFRFASCLCARVPSAATAPRTTLCSDAVTVFKHTLGVQNKTVPLRRSWPSLNGRSSFTCSCKCTVSILKSTLLREHFHCGKYLPFTQNGNKINKRSSGFVCVCNDRTSAKNMASS